MKVRMGFVSNSSTSSYLIITTPANHEATLAALGEKGETLRNRCKLFQRTKILGRNAIVFEYASGNDGLAPEDILEGSDEVNDVGSARVFADMAYDLVNAYIDQAKKNPECYVKKNYW